MDGAGRKGRWHGLKKKHNSLICAFLSSSLWFSGRPTLHIYYKGCVGKHDGYNRIVMRSSRARVVFCPSQIQTSTLPQSSEWQILAKPARIFIPSAAGFGNWCHSLVVQIMQAHEWHGDFQPNLAALSLYHPTSDQH